MGVVHFADEFLVGFWAEVAVDGGLELVEGLDHVFEAGWWQWGGWVLAVRWREGEREVGRGGVAGGLGDIPSTVSRVTGAMFVELRGGALRGGRSG